MPPPLSRTSWQVIRGRAGPADSTPVYDDTGLLDRILLGLFRSKLADEVGGDTFEPGYDGLMQMIRVLNEKFPSKRQTQEASRCGGTSCKKTFFWRYSVTTEMQRQ